MRNAYQVVGRTHQRREKGNRDQRGGVYDHREPYQKFGEGYVLRRCGEEGRLRAFLARGHGVRRARCARLGSAPAGHGIGTRSTAVIHRVRLGVCHRAFAGGAESPFTGCNGSPSRGHAPAR